MKLANVPRRQTVNNRVDSYTVGYKKPPKESQFKPGKSGNAKGRPRQVRSIKDYLESELRSVLHLNAPGKSKTIPKLEALVKLLVALALKGNIGAVRIVLANISDTPSAKERTLEDLVAEFEKRNTQLTKAAGETAAQEDTAQNDRQSLAEDFSSDE
jgi:hypothetical protein